MNPNEFVYWLQGYFELTNSNTLTEEQVTIIKDHLRIVFNREQSDILHNFRSYPPSQSSLIEWKGGTSC